MSDTFTPSASTESLGTAIDRLFGDISNQLLFQELLIGMAASKAYGGDVECEALISAVHDKMNYCTGLILENLQNHVTELIERVRALEVSHGC